MLMPISIPTLPQDIIANILSRIPVKSLMQFRCVCKPWNSLIRDPQFVKLHLAKAATDVNAHRVFIFGSESIAANDEETDAVVTHDFPLDLVDDELVVAGSCNGLLCLARGANNYILWNLSMRELKELPKSNISADRSFNMAYGFCYDSSGDDYKIVRAVSYSTSDGLGRKVEVEIFSLKSGSWRRIEDYHSGVQFTENGVFTSGALHWLGYKEGENRSSIIVSFNLKTEKFEQVLELPGHDKTIIQELIEIRGYMYGTCVLMDTGAELWIMKEYGVKASWTKVLTISFAIETPPHEFHLTPMCFTKNDKVLINMDDRGFVMYNPRERTFRHRFQDHWDGEQMIMYLESLVSPNYLCGRN